LSIEINVLILSQPIELTRGFKNCDMKAKDLKVNDRVKFNSRFHTIVNVSKKTNSNGVLIVSVECISPKGGFQFSAEADVITK